MSDASRLVLGTAQWGLRYGIANRTGPPDADAVAAIVAQARAAGVVTLDTARTYGDAEEVVGRATAAGSWRIVTKLAPDVAGDGIDEGEARSRAIASLEASRRALRRPGLDTVLLHRPEHRTASHGGAWAVLREERDAGRVGRIGVSLVDVAGAATLLDDPDVAVIQAPASLLDQRLTRSGFFERAAESGREVFVRSIYLQGVGHLAADHLPDHLAQLETVLDGLDSVARARGIDRGALFLGWARQLGDARVVIGCETVAQLEANLAAWDLAGLDEAVTEADAVVPTLPDAVLDPWRWPAAGP